LQFGLEAVPFLFRESLEGRRRRAGDDGQGQERGRRDTTGNHTSILPSSALVRSVWLAGLAIAWGRPGPGAHQQVQFP